MFTGQNIIAQQNCTVEIRDSNFLTETFDESAVNRTSGICRYYLALFKSIYLLHIIIETIQTVALYDYKDRSSASHFLRPFIRGR